MRAPRLHILAWLLVGCLPTVRAQETPPATGEAAVATEADTQLRINKTTLLENKNQKNRVDAATLLLFNDNPAARTILLDVLKATDNPAARAAVCEALDPTRTWQRPLKNKEDFVQPLIGIITSEEDFAIAKLAAEATLIFAYSQVQQEFEKAVTNSSLSPSVRMNVIYAMRRHPDKEAVAKLVSLVDGPDPQVAEAARSALASVGISVSADPAVRRQMFTELQQRGAEAFLRERLIRQEMRMRELETEITAWQKRYRTVLNNLYDSFTDEAARNKFLAQQLSAPETTVRLWALDKVEELRKGTGKPKLSELEAALLGLIVDPDKQVRLKTARLLALMAELNAAKPLLEQLKVEQDDQVRREMFVALGGACYFASLPTAGHKLPEEIRRETLEWAVKFLNETDTEKARNGAEVIGKLLEQDGLKPVEVDKYLKALADRYVQAGAATDHGLRGYLLGAMAGLCAPRSTCRVQAAKLYGTLFEQAVADKADVVRLAGVDGMVNIDKPAALGKLRAVVGDPSRVIRLKLIDLAGEIGEPQDLDWLAEKLGAAGESEPAWQAMLKVFRRSGLPVLADWTARIQAPAMDAKISPEQKVSFLTLVEQKAQSEDDQDLLKNVRKNLAQLYFLSNNLKQAGEYFQVLLGVGADDQERQQLRLQLLQVYLRSSSLEQAGEMVAVCLSGKGVDLGPEGVMVKSIEEYLNGPAGADPNALLKTLQQVKVKDPETGQLWRALLGRWEEKFAKAKKPEEADRANN
jgi:hypothetical protein